MYENQKSSPDFYFVFNTKELLVFTRTKCDFLLKNSQNLLSFRRFLLNCYDGNLEFSEIMTVP